MAKKVKLSNQQAHRFMKVSEEYEGSNLTTSLNLGLNVYDFTAELNFESCKIAYISYVNVIYGYYINGRGNVITCILEHGMVLFQLVSY